jgi:creatinine amidohydrolase
MRGGICGFDRCTASLNKITYGDMSWPEVKDVVSKKKVALIPVGSTEQHGPHLPTKTDAFLATRICEQVAKEKPGLSFVMPVVSYGYNEHHMDFPATIHINHETMIRFVIDIGKSLAHHGVEKIVIVNGHGSNMAPMEIAARRITLESTRSLCASLDYLAIAPQVFDSLDGEDAHAGEIETSLMLYLDPENVDMSKAVRDWAFEKSKFINYGVEPGGKSFGNAGGKVQFMDWWSRMSATGTMGDPTKSTKEKGEKIFHLCTGALLEFVEEFQRREIRERVDHH